MFKLYFGNSTAIISTLLLLANIGYGIWGYLNQTTIRRWGITIIGFILLHGLLWYFSNIRDLYSNSILYAIDGSAEMGLFSANSIQSIIFWIISVTIWVLGFVAIFKPQYRQLIFYIIISISFIQILFIECSRILLYHSIPDRFNYM